MGELRRLPKMDRLLAAPEVHAWNARVGKKALTALAREVVAEARAEVRAGQDAPTLEQLVTRVGARARETEGRALQPVINATGIVLHTNLGRAPLPSQSLQRLQAIATGYCSVELDIAVGSRARRAMAAEAALAELCDAEAALIVNNNAAAVLLVLSHLAAGREVIVSRGELVEIGGGFRIPDVLARSGARLVEVGTTNRTRAEDYRRAIGEHTACLLRVHPSNFKMTGFVERPRASELAQLAAEHDVPMVEDLGGGRVVRDLGELVGPATDEPTVQACVRDGADAVCFSLDKLFGGPQGGAIVGKRTLIEKLARDPLARALRVDKLTLAALEPVLQLYATDASSDLPVLRMLRTGSKALEERAAGWLAALEGLGFEAEVRPTQGAIGGGTLAATELASWGLVIHQPDPEKLAALLRAAPSPVLGRVSEGALVLDARTVLPPEDAALIAALRDAVTKLTAARGVGCKS